MQEYKDVEGLWVASDDKSDKTLYLNLPALYQLNADVYLVWGKRGPGKTYSVIKQCLLDNHLRGDEFVYMRTREEFILPKFAKRAIANNQDWYNLELCQGAACVTYYAGQYVRRWMDDETGKWQREPIGYTVSIGGWQKYKSNGFPKVKTIFLDEFIDPPATQCSRNLTTEEYLDGWSNNLSTIIRNRTGVKVVCCANAQNPRCPIFDYYGIDSRAIEQGNIYIFTDKNSGLKICCYYTPDMTVEPDQQKHIAVAKTAMTNMIMSGAWVDPVYKSRWNGLDIKKLLRTKQYDKSRRFQPDEYPIDIYLPINVGYPLVVTHRNGCMNRIDLPTFHAGFYPTIAKCVLQLDIKKQVVSVDDKCSGHYIDWIRKLKR